jgi:hypothetical protein
MGRLKSNTKGWDRLKKRLVRFDRRSFDVGFFEDKKYGSENDNLSVAEVAMINDGGSSTNPPRPFFSVDFKDYADKSFQKKAKKLFVALVLQTNVAYVRELKSMGAEYSLSLKTFILDYPGSNSDDWAEAKGFNDPLYHTGTMASAVDYRITKRNF